MSDRQMFEKGRSNWFGGAVLIFMGLAFLLPAFGIVGWDQMWIVFPLIPIAAILYGAWQRYEANGRRLDGRLFAILIWSLLPFAYLVSIWADLDVGRLWPISFILAGVTALLVHPERRSEDA